MIQYIWVHQIILSNGIHLMKKTGEITIVRLNTIILTKVKVKSINYVSLPVITSYKFRGGSIRLVAVYFCDHSHYDLLEIFLKGNNYIMTNWFRKEKSKAVMMRVDITKILFPCDITVSYKSLINFHLFVNIILINTYANYNLQFNINLLSFSIILI